ncbi:hypothetical protein ACWGQ4_15025 [Streptomyces sp. NPDC055721]
MSWRWEYDPDEESDAFVPGGMFSYLVLPRHECVYLRQVTYW